MKTILCFGDSNTWGWDPVATKSAVRPQRHAPDVRWPGVLRQELGANATIIEEGQSGRTTVHDDPIEGNRNGRTYLIPCLDSHQPLDIVVLMLGSNDLKTRFSLSAGDIATGAAALVQLILGSTAGPDGTAPKLLLLAPPGIGEMSRVPDLPDKFAEAARRAQRFPELYQKVANQFRCGFLNSQEFVIPSTVDGLHLEASEHAKLGLAVAKRLRELGWV